MKYCVLALLAALASGQQVDRRYHLTANGTTEVRDNRDVGCLAWSMSYTDNGFSALTVTLQSSANNSSWSTFDGTTVSGSNPLTATTYGFYTATGFVSFVRVNVTGISGTGSVDVSLQCWKSPNYLAVLGGNPASPVGSVQFNLAGAFGGDAAFLYSKTNHELTLTATAGAAGSELITNGGFTGSAAGWTLGSDVAYGSNNVVSTYAGGDPSLTSATFATVAGTIYRVQFTISASNSSMDWFLAHSSNSEEQNIGNGTFVQYFVATYTGAAEAITFDDWNYDMGDTWTLSNVSVKALSSLSPVLNILTLDGNPYFIFGSDVNGNTSLGESALPPNSGFGNAAFGYDALSSITTSSGNSAFGYQALSLNSTGNGGNAAFGYQALQNSTDYANTAIGYGALSASDIGYENTAIGAYALTHLNGPGGSGSSKSQDNVAIGALAMVNSISGWGNVAVGVHSLDSTTGLTANLNTAIGNGSGNSNTSGANNVFVGAYSGYYSTTDSNSFYLDDRDRTNTAGDKAGALLYGTFNATPSSQTLTTNASFRLNVDTPNPFINLKTTGSAVAPGAGKADLRWLAGTNAGTCKLVSNAGTSATEVTIIDNVGAGC